MPDSLATLQQTFTRCVAALIAYATAQGIGLTFGEAWRSPEEAAILAKEGKGIVQSVHCDRLAVDLNCFVAGVYVTDPAPYTILGKYWKGLYELARWGGDFTTKDFNHFSFEYDGRS
jgi:hypothetical protein